MYCNYSIANASHIEFHVFSDASKEAIAAVAFLKVWKDDEHCDIGFLLRKAKKVAAPLGHTIPRLELCGYVLDVELAEIAKDQLRLDNSNFWFYTEGQIALGYIGNDSRRFYVHVANRVSRIRAFSEPERWQHVPTSQNPADLATRTLHVEHLPNSMWIQGPEFLRNVSKASSTKGEPEMDVEVKPCVSVNKSNYSKVQSTSVSSRFERYSSWTNLVRTIAILHHVVSSLKSPCKHSNKIWHHCPSSMNTDSFQSAKYMILREVQHDAFSKEIHCAINGMQLPKGSSIISLSPFLDPNGLLRVGGRLTGGQDSIRWNVHHIIVPKKSHVALLLVRHFHEELFHQGRKLTEGKLRSSGFWVIGAKRLVSSVINKCVNCRKLRGSFCT